MEPQRKLSKMSFFLPKSARPKPCAHDFGISRTAAELQGLQLENLKSSLSGGVCDPTAAASSAIAMRVVNEDSRSDGAKWQSSRSSLREALLQIKMKKKYIYLEEKRVRYHYRKSKTREKGAVPLDISQTRLVIPAHGYAKPDVAGEYERVQQAQERSCKPDASEALNEPGPGRDADTHWVFLVTKLREGDKARILALRFMDKLEEQVWMHSLRVKLMEPDLLMNIISSAFESIC
jgi:hypothetical protein